MTLLSCVGTFSRLTPPILPEPGFLEDDGEFYKKNLTFVSTNAIPNGVTPEGGFVNTDGSRVFIIIGNGTIYQYDLSSPFDLSTMTYNDVTFNVSSQTGTTSANRDLWFDYSGERLYVIADATDRVVQYSLDTAWDVSSATYTNNFFNLTTITGDSSHKGITISPEGTKYLVVGAGSDSIYELTMTVPWDISSSTYENHSLSLVSLGESVPESITASPDGKNVIVVGTAKDAPFEFNLAVPWDITTATFNNGYWAGRFIAPTLKGVHYHPEGYLFFITQSTNSISKLVLGETQKQEIPFNIVNKSYDVVEDTTNRVNCVRFNADGTKVFLLKGEQLYEYLLPTPYDITNISFTTNIYPIDVEGGTLVVGTFIFGDNGFRLYTSGFNNSGLKQYQLSTAYDPSTAVLVNERLFLSTGTGLNMGTGASLMDLHITSDGTKMFVSLSNSTYGHGIFRADFLTPWDVSTLVRPDLTNPQYKFINSANGLSGAQAAGFAFNSDAKRLYVFDRNLIELRQYRLANAYSIGSAVYEKNYRLNYLDTSTFSNMSILPLENRLYFYGNSQRYLTQFKV